MYTPQYFEEAGMSTPDKVSALNNLETQYDESISYLAGIDHADRYYTQAQCDAAYFSARRQGEGSGLICEKVGGLTATEIMALGVPSGIVAYWAGSAASIPTGWTLCNGLNGTDDTRDRFVIGAGGDYNPGDKGGAHTVTVSGTVSVDSHILTLDEIPSHNHSWTDYAGSPTATAVMAAGSYARTWGSLLSMSRYTEYTGGGLGHGHPESTFTGTTGQDKRPPFMALCRIYHL